MLLALHFFQTLNGFAVNLPLFFIVRPGIALCLGWRACAPSESATVLRTGARRDSLDRNTEIMKLEVYLTKLIYPS
jgi:hypothetical protein